MFSLFITVTEFSRCPASFSNVLQCSRFRGLEYVLPPFWKKLTFRTTTRSTKYNFDLLLLQKYLSNSDVYILLWKYFSRQIYSYSFHIYKLNNLKVIDDLYSQYLTQTLSETSAFHNEGSIQRGHKCRIKFHSLPVISGRKNESRKKRTLWEPPPSPSVKCTWGRPQNTHNTRGRPTGEAVHGEEAFPECQISSTRGSLSRVPCSLSVKI
jgi:hypothetical protein